MPKQDTSKTVENTKNTDEQAQQAESNNTPSELDQLRKIVFGAAKADIESDLKQLRHEMKMNFDQVAKTQQLQMSELQSSVEEHVQKLDDRITWVDNHHEDKNAEINSYANTLASELEINELNSKQQDDDLEKLLNREIEQLTDKFTKQHQQTIDLLNQVKSDLNSSKTDRKTLAKLLATVASNLETDDEF